MGCGSTGATPSGGGSSNSSLTANQATVQFGNVLVGTPKNQNLSVTNSGSQNVVVTAVSFTGTNSSAFSLVQAPSLPLTVSPGQTVPVVLQVLATAAGSLSATMTVTSDATSGPVNVGLSATATVPTFSIAGSVGFAGSGATISLTGTSSATATADGSGNYQFSGLANGSYTVTPTKNSLVFAPSSRTVTINNANVTGINFTGPGQLALGPSSFTFSNVTLGTTSAPQTGALTASGASVIVNFDTLTGAGFGFSGISFPLTIAAGQSVNFSVTFTPSAAGNTSGSLAFDSNAANSPSAATLSGSASGLAATPSNLNFGVVLDGTTSASQTGTLSAVGANVTVTSATQTGSFFSVTGLPSVPFVILAGQSVQYTVAFAPQAGSPGPASGSLSFASSANSVSQTFSGTATSNVVLSWSSSTSPNVTYNVYRCSVSAVACIQSQPANFSQIATAVSNLGYVDGQVASGQTYYYAVTAVDTSLNESVLSGVSSPAVIP